MKTAQNTFLLVEDDLVDVLTLQRALQDLGIDYIMKIASTGEEALHLLAEMEEALPELILMDLNMPRMNGIELLTELKQHSVWRRIPVVILTTSNQQQEREQCFALSVAGYIVKPLDYNAFVEVIRIICEYWCINELIH